MFTTEIRGRGYQTEPFAFDECVAIQLELGKIMGGVAGPVVEFASALFTLNKDTGQMSFDPGKGGDDASGETLGRAVVAIPAGIIAAGGPAFIRRVLARTSIEDESITGDKSLQVYELDSPHLSGVGTWLDHIYTGGNSVELYLALGWVIAVNFSPFGHSGSWNWRSLWAELRAAIPQLSAMSIGTSPPSPDGRLDTPEQTP